MTPCRIARSANKSVLALTMLLFVRTFSAELAWTEHDGYRAAPVTHSGAGRTGFRVMSPEATGVRFFNRLPVARHYTNQILLNGSGVAAGDLDEDGRCDLVFGGLSGQSAIYRNLGDWKFEDITRQCTDALAGLDVTGVVLADADGDSDLDLLVNTVGQGTRLLLNEGRGRLAAAADGEPLNAGRCGSSMALADMDGDGDLDLYVANYRINTTRDEPHLGLTIRHENGQPRVTAYGDRPITDPDLAHRFKFHYQETAGGGGTVFHDEQGEPDGFYRNLGQGRFEPISFTGGAFRDNTGRPLTASPYDWGLSVMIRDLSGDGFPDIYVCNDFSTPDRIWINDGAGRFRALPDDAIRQTSLSTMAVDVADLNRDGFDDIFTADMLSPDRWRRLVQINQPNPNMHLFVDIETRPQVTRNTLQINRGDGTYAEVAQMAGLEASDWSWASIFLDVDLDGYEDLLVANGFERDFMNMDAHRRVLAAQARVPRGQPPEAKLAANRFYPRLVTANLAFRNLGNLRFAEVGAAWGFDVKEVSHGMALADLDQDGDLDVAINNLNGRASLLRNDTTAPRLAVRLQGKSPNTRGIGARIEVQGGPVVAQSQEMLAGGRYLSGDEAMRVFAAGSPTNRLQVEVVWRGGARTVLTNLAPNHIYEIRETGARAERRATPPAVESESPLFAEADDLLDHVHKQDPVDGFEAQPMLPRSLASLGPGLSWLDLQAGAETALMVAGGRGGTPALLRRSGSGSFTPVPAPVLNQPLEHSQSALLGWTDAEGATRWFSAQEDGTVRLYAWNREQITLEPPLPSLNSSPGPMALADLDGDGDLDLFVGGRSIPGRWPESASSMILLRENDGWSLDHANSNRLHHVGLVSGAVFTDLDQDGDADLVLAEAWGPIRILMNDRGRLSESERDVSFADGAAGTGDIATLGQLTGWWNGVGAGDFDGDGRMDLIASNWGRNSKYERFRSRPVRVYYGDFIGDGRVDILEAWFDPELRKHTPIHDVWTLSRSLPWLLARFPNYASFSRVGVEEALGDFFPKARFKEAAWFDTTVLLNRGDHFEVRALPWSAQVSPAFATCVADYDGDSHEDVFLSQNFFGVRRDDSRYDAGRGLLLLGNGRGDFQPLKGTESGIMIYGEQRGAAAGDYDGDGRVDLAVTQHGGRTRLLHNQGARPGWRVRLRGRPGNSPAFGAKLRLKTGDTWGPVREIHGGSGYWSQDGAVQVLTRPGGADAEARDPVEIWVQWPGGKTTRTSIRDDAGEIVIEQP